MEFPRLDLRQVEDVIENAQEILAVALDRLDGIEPFGPGNHGRQDIGESQDCRHWGADLMAHAGQERALSLTCHLGGILRMAQFIQDSSPFRNVPEDIDDTSDLPVSNDELGTDLNEDRIAVLVLEFRFHKPIGLAISDRLTEELDHSGDVSDAQDAESKEMLADDVCRPVTEDLFDPCIHIQHLA